MIFDLIQNLHTFHNSGRIPSYFGTIPAEDAAKQILDGVRRNYVEFSVPGYILYLGNISR